MDTYCVYNQNNGFVIQEYKDFKESGNNSTVLFIGTFKECLGFVARSNAEQELVQNRETLCTNPAVSFVQKYNNYEQKNFQSTERLIEILNKQNIIRGTQHIFHKLHLIRNL